MSLEVVGKALLVLAVVVILLFIFKSLLGKGADNLGDIGDTVGNDAKLCIDNPSDPKCKWSGTSTPEKKDDTAANGAG